MRALLLCLLAAATTPVMAADPLRFWNLTTETITDLRLAPAGTSDFGPNQCLNDRDKEVDSDERLRLTGVEPGRYDVRVGFKRGRQCTASNVELKSGGKYAFSLEAGDLKDCH